MVSKLPKYEYKTVPMPKFINEFDQKLNELAKDMWELSTIFNPPNTDFCFQPEQSKAGSLFAIFKRQLS